MSTPTRFSSYFTAPWLTTIIIAVAAMVLISGPIAAQSHLLDSARAAGTVGERHDGIAIIRAGASEEVAQIVKNINDQRLAIYRKRAAAEGISTEAVGQIYAKQIFQKAPTGTWFLNASGQWVRK